MWTRSKFGMDSQLDSVSTETRGLTTEIVLRKSVETLVGTHPGQREKCRISCLVQHASVYVDEFDAEDDLLDRAKNRRAHNSEAPFSGSHALLFQLSLFVSSDSSTWWRNERLRLLSFVSYLPIGSRVPLLLLYWCNGELSREEFMSQVAFRLDLPSLLADDGGPIVAIDLKVIEASSNDFNHEAASLAFTSGLRWLAESTVPDPILGSDIIRDVIETFTADPVRFALEKIDKLIPFDANFALDTECISKHGMYLWTFSIFSGSYKPNIGVRRKLQHAMAGQRIFDKW
ncbi:hypothetical protein BC829DRAFT_143722 [Chytridium lagenaria]|nr:hypothetical protein BC829DRAFT_143722 [Chytridium lagenaria]